MINENVVSGGVKFILVTFGAIVSAQLRILYPVLIFLIIEMIFDYGSGVAAAKYEKLKFPEDKTKGLSSKIGFMGILKKSMYGVLVVVGMTVDFLVVHLASELGIQFPYPAFFGLLVAVWLILNDALSILENCVRMDLGIPPFLEKVVMALKIKVEDKGLEHEDVAVKEGSETVNAHYDLRKDDK
ncbi:phage holin family protein [Vagococcus sp. BWB3-3]|uniref:Phage holin family protein n=1 Tax=Vagococcus allomyrinae TaxID=2794353 RepID=A0A940PCR7_9ENTE|nr:phage holin family protein [Vagococcus allomyrinae]MBP1040358.1 phage holin family protein [Vagococcus allomyrinae]